MLPGCLPIDVLAFSFAGIGWWGKMSSLRGRLAGDHWSVPVESHASAFVLERLWHILLLPTVRSQIHVAIAIPSRAGDGSA